MFASATTNESLDGMNAMLLTPMVFGSLRVAMSFPVVTFHR